jgi:hypothetical protein
MSLNEKHVHADHNQDEKYDGNLGQFDKTSIRGVVLGIVHGWVALRRVDAHQEQSFWLSGVISPLLLEVAQSASRSIERAVRSR